MLILAHCFVRTGPKLPAISRADKLKCFVGPLSFVVNWSCFVMGAALKCEGF